MSADPTYARVGCPIQDVKDSAPSRPVRRYGGSTSNERQNGSYPSDETDKSCVPCRAVLFRIIRYFRTGDLGRMEDDTYLLITGRIKEQYKLENGKYVVPGPIEAAMVSSTYISQVCGGSGWLLQKVVPEVASP